MPRPNPSRRDGAGFFAISTKWRLIIAFTSWHQVNFWDFIIYNYYQDLLVTYRIKKWIKIRNWKDREQRYWNFSSFIISLKFNEQNFPRIHLINYLPDFYGTMKYIIFSPLKIYFVYILYLKAKLDFWSYDSW